MNLLFLTYHLPSPREPGTSRPWQVAQIFKELGYRVTVVTGGRNYLTGELTRPPGIKPWVKEEAQGITILKTYIPPEHRRSKATRLFTYALYSLISFAAGLTVPRPDILIVGCDVPTLVPPAIALAKLYRARLILEEREIFPEAAAAVGFTHNKAILLLVDKILRLCRSQAERFITVSPTNKELLIKKGIKPHHIFVITNAFLEELSTDGLALPAEVEHVVTNAFVVLYAGGLGLGASEIFPVLEAAAMVQERQVADVRFVFLGEGERKEKYIQFCRERGIGNCIFLPLMRRELVPLILEKASIGLHSLKRHWWTGALSTKIFEYMAHQKPVVFAGEG
ncbi:MAG: glycosyltransferase family 4 protein, partial [Dehalococcoidia bacterium]